LESVALSEQVKQLSEELELQKYELERSKTQIQSMTDDTRQSLSSNKLIKSFLSETESGRILNHLLGLEQITIDELAAMTGIATFTVQQIVQHFRDTGLVTIEEGTRRVRIAEQY
jgi:predicted transcriptional regulator